MRRAFPSALRAIVIALMSAAAPALAQVTETPQTVAPGKLIVEMEGLSLGFDRHRDDGGHFTALTLANTLVSAGITSAVDLQVGATLLVRQKFDSGGLSRTQTGLGDLVFRAKWKFWGDEKIGAAFAVMPYVKVPANTGGVGNKAVEGGVIFPWELNLPGGAMVGAMFQWDVLRNDAGNGYDSRWSATGFIQQKLTEAWCVYGEATLAVDSASWARRTGAMGVGAMWQFSKVVQFDYELLRGLNRQATDWTHVFRINWGW